MILLKNIKKMADDSGRPSTEVLIHDSADTDKELGKNYNLG